MKSLSSRLPVVIASFPFLCPQAFAKPTKGASTPADAPDIAKFIQCQATPKEYNGFAMEFAGDAEKAKRWGWKKIETGTGLLSVFALAKPILIHGEQTSRIAFSGSGIVAMVSAGRAPALAKALDLTTEHTGPQASVYGKVLRSTEEKIGDLVIKSRTQISVSTSAAYPGATLVGCSYSVNVQ